MLLKTRMHSFFNAVLLLSPSVFASPQVTGKGGADQGTAKGKKCGFFDNITGAGVTIANVRLWTTHNYERVTNGEQSITPLIIPLEADHTKLGIRLIPDYLDTPSTSQNRFQVV
jgi:hypothetical protein